jgi:hypothetical protein
MGRSKISAQKEIKIMSKTSSLQKQYQNNAKSAFHVKSAISDQNIIIQYFQRLIASSTRTIVGEATKAHFITDYLNGEGDELGGKFFSPYSSSRLCFDLYSWLGSPEYYSQGYEVVFEKYLPRLQLHKSNPHPNMDVMIRRGDSLLFVESKFTETTKYPCKKKDSQNDFGLPISYSENLDKLSPEDLKVLKERYYDNEEAAKGFHDFIVGINSFANGHHTENDWFDPKQESTHLFGILFYLLGNDKSHSVQTDFGGAIKHVYFLNVVYGFDFKKSEMAKEFLKKGNALIKGLLKPSQPSISFDYGAISVQQFYQTVIANKNPLVFALEKEKPLSDLLKDERYYHNLNLDEKNKVESEEDGYLRDFFKPISR